MFGITFIEDIFIRILQAFAASWWIVVPLILFFIFWDLWLFYIRRKFVLKIKWILLEIKIPRSVEKTPKAMEQVYAALRAVYSYGMTLKQKYWLGQVEHWFSFEMVGQGGGLNFYVRTPDDHRNLVESALYAQYPDAEITEVDDYVELIGTTLPNKVFDLWGADFILSREDAYPIRTYPAFEEKQEEARLDPIATIAEVMSRLQAGEMILIQVLIRPTGDEWVKKGEELRDKLLDRKKAKAEPFFDLGAFMRNLTVAPFEHPAWAEEDKKNDKEKLNVMFALTPGEREVIEGIEKKLAKLAFECIIRFIYVDHRESFTRSHISAVVGAFHQFNTHNLNAFRPDRSSFTVIKKGLFKKKRVYLRKRRIFDNYRLRRLPRKVSILNLEELATVHHVPSIAVEAPMLRHVPAKRGEPPAGLPVE